MISLHTQNKNSLYTFIYVCMKNVLICDERTKQGKNVAVPSLFSYPEGVINILWAIHRATPKKAKERSNKKKTCIIKLVRKKYFAHCYWLLFDFRCPVSKYVCVYPSVNTRYTQAVYTRWKIGGKSLCACGKIRFVLFGMFGLKCY